MKREIFLVSDGTGITAEKLGHSLLTQFQNIDFNQTTLPYVDTLDKADTALAHINEVNCSLNAKPIVFLTVINPILRKHIAQCQGTVIDLFGAFLKPLEEALETKSSYTIGLSHAMADEDRYNTRMDAVNYALVNDDGCGAHTYARADMIILGVSRSGKTPTCLYLALQFGIYAANYPFVSDDMPHLELPKFLSQHRKKLFGLTIDPKQLSQIRTERRPNSEYASIKQCQTEIKEIEALFKREKIPYLNSTTQSIEEISTKLIAKTDVKRRF